MIFFDSLGRFVSRHWRPLLVGWIVALVGLWIIAPPLKTVLQDGDFQFLPRELPSVQAEKLFKSAFESDLLKSSIVVVAHRENSPEGLTDDDKSFIDDKLVPKLAQLAGMPDSSKNAGDSDSIVADIRTFSDKDIGPLLISDDQKATLVIMELKTEFTERKNDPLINQIEQTIGRPGQPGQLQQEKGFPRGLELSLSGLATVGRDMRHAAQKSAEATQMATVVLVIILLLAIYRAPILAVIPLLTVFVSVEIAMHILCILAGKGYVTLFAGIEVYVTVVLYGAGIDYCMFLMARYKEELDNGATFEEAIATSVSKVGHALAASAGTVMLGIGMMIFCRFGKFQDAGIAMSSSLIFVLAASLTMTPALLMLVGRWAFWPSVQTERLSAAQGWVSPTSMVSRLLQKEWFGNFWGNIGEALLKRPGTIFITAVLLMTPFAVIAVLCQDKLSYGLLSELPSAG